MANDIKPGMIFKDREFNCFVKVIQISDNRIRYDFLDNYKGIWDFILSKENFLKRYELTETSKILYGK